LCFLVNEREAVEGTAVELSVKEPKRVLDELAVDRTGPIGPGGSAHPLDHRHAVLRDHRTRLLLMAGLDLHAPNHRIHPSSQIVGLEVIGDLGRVDNSE
jgi:hypothetical protein